MKQTDILDAEESFIFRKFNDFEELVVMDGLHFNLHNFIFDIGNKWWNQGYFIICSLIL